MKIITLLFFPLVLTSTCTKSDIFTYIQPSSNSNFKVFLYSLQECSINHPNILNLPENLLPFTPNTEITFSKDALTAKPCSQYEHSKVKQFSSTSPWIRKHFEKVINITCHRSQDQQTYKDCLTLLTSPTASFIYTPRIPLNGYYWYNLSLKTYGISKITITFKVLFTPRSFPSLTYNLNDEFKHISFTHNKEVTLTLEASQYVNYINFSFSFLRGETFDAELQVINLTVQDTEINKCKNAQDMFDRGLEDSCPKDYFFDVLKVHL